MWQSALWDHSLLPIQWGAVIGASLAAAVFDLRQHRIPNLLTGPVLLAGIIWGSCVAGFGGLGDSLGGMICAALPFVLMFLFGGGGAGDAKMMAAIGAWLGTTGGVLAMVLVVIAGAVLALGYAVCRRRGMEAIRNIALMSLGAVLFVRNRSLMERVAVLPSLAQMQVLPYGPAIFMGVVFAGGVAYLWR